MRFLLLVICLIIGSKLFSQNDSGYYTLKVRLIKAEPNPPGCGVLAWALTQKFEIIESDHSFMKSGYPILLNEPCPEFLGTEYFRTNRIYKVKISKNSGAPFSYIVINKYEKEKLPLYWIREINLIIN